MDPPYRPHLLALSAALTWIGARLLGLAAMILMVEERHRENWHGAQGGKD